MSISQIRVDRTKSGSAYNTPSVPFYIFFFSWCEIYYQQRVYIERVGNSCDQWVKIGRIGENCGDYELSKEAGSLKSLWVHFLVIEKDVELLNGCSNIISDCVSYTC